MGAPLVVAGAALRHRRRVGPWLLAALLVLLAVFLILLMGVLGATFGLQGVQGGSGPSAAARAEIPPVYLQLYMQAGQQYGIDPWVLAGIGFVETDHGRSTAPGVHSG